MKEKRNILVIENFSFSNFFHLFGIKRKIDLKGSSILFLNSTKIVLILYKIFPHFFKNIQKLNFEKNDLVENNGDTSIFKILDQDIFIFFNKIYKDQNLKFSKSEIKTDNYFETYFRKKLCSDGEVFKSSNLEKLFLLFGTIPNHVKRKNLGTQIYFLIDQRPWLNEISNYASKYNIKLVQTKKYINLNIKKKFLKYLKGNYIIRNFYYFLNLKKSKNKLLTQENLSKINKTNNIAVGTEVVIGRDRLELWSHSEIPKKNIIFLGNYKKIDKDKIHDIKNLNMKFISLQPNIAKGLDVPFYVPSIKKNYYEKIILNNKDLLEKTVLAENFEQFINEKKFWKDFFLSTNTKIITSNAKHAYWSVPISAAINDNKGIFALIQNSFYEFPRLNASISSNIYFSFSNKFTHHVEKKMNSKIDYDISVGYPTDYKFKLDEEKSIAVRKKIQKQGAKKIVALLDKDVWSIDRIVLESPYDGLSSFAQQKMYKFWFEKILKEEWLGLVVKPKKPLRLRKSLGKHISILMDKAVKTGRCHLYLESSALHNHKNTTNTPAEAAMASDIAIYSDILSCTAGLETALAGIPTLLFDRNKMTMSKLYDLGIGTVIFHDWQKLWDNLEKHWKNSPIPRFGDWSQIIADMDPFRDGMAAKRITSYLACLLDGYNKGLDRDSIMSKAAEKYSKEWGSDKVKYLGKN